MTELTDIVNRRRRREREFFEHLDWYLQRIKQLASRRWPNSQVFLFGSVRRGEQTAGSDIDVLVYAPDLPDFQSDRTSLTTDITEALGVFHPFELHYANRKQLEWYESFAGLEEVV